VASALAQSWRPLEVVVVDDGSADDTPAVLAALAQAHPEVRHLRHDAARGPGAARNSGLGAARGELVAFLDDDDEWLPGRLAAMVAALGPQTAFVYTDYLRVRGPRRRRKRLPRRMDHRTLLRHGCQVNHILARRADLLAIGGYDETLAFAEDYEMMVRLLEGRGSALGVPQPLLVYHATDRGGRLSTRRAACHRDELRVYRRHKPLLTRAERRARLARVRRILHPEFSLRAILTLCRGRDLLQELRRWGKRHLLRLAGA
jgi:glycosyltransferase involved in cell wall biosynthesis